MPLENPSENVLELIASSCWVIRVGGGSDEEKEQGNKLFQLRKSEGHQLLKAQHVLWLHYPIMDCWCDCHWRNCHCGLFCDWFLPDCWTHKWSKALPPWILGPENIHLRFEDDGLDAVVFFSYPAGNIFVYHHIIYFYFLSSGAIILVQSSVWQIL